MRTLGTPLLGSGARARLSILIYHRVLSAPDPMLPDEIDVNTFRIHMDALAEGFNILPLHEATRKLRDGCLPPRAACISFDDGYANNVTVALPILLERSLSACFFISTAFLDGRCMWNDIVIEAIRQTKVSHLDMQDIGLGEHLLDCRESRLATIARLLPQLKKLSPDARSEAVDAILNAAERPSPKGMMMTREQVRSLAEAGMEVGGHTVTHPILSTLTDEEATTEIRDGKDELESITGQRVTLFAYPNGRPGADFTSKHVSLIKKLGFEAAVTTANGISRQSTNPFLLPRFTPWDRTSLRFTLRLYQNALLGDRTPV